MLKRAYRRSTLAFRDVAMWIPSLLTVFLVTGWLLSKKSIVTVTNLPMATEVKAGGKFWIKRVVEYHPYIDRVFVKIVREMVPDLRNVSEKNKEIIIHDTRNFPTIVADRNKSKKIRRRLFIVPYDIETGDWIIRTYVINDFFIWTHRERVPDIYVRVTNDISE